MKQILPRLRALVLLAVALGLALAAGAGAEGAFLGSGEAAALGPGELAEVELGDEPAAFTFTPPSGSVYDAFLFPAGDAPASAHAELWQGETLVGEGDGTLPALSLRLTAGTEYTLRLTGEGRIRLEIARHAQSRCFDLPMALDAEGDAYAKAFARQGDAHWYAIDAEDPRAVAITGVPAEEGVRLLAQLFDGNGALLAESEGTGGGACLMSFEPEAGRRYRLRLTSLDGATGLYDLRIARVEGPLAGAVTLSRAALLVEGRSGARLEAALEPAGAGGPIYWESSNPGAALVSADGQVTGRSAGEAVITAYAAGGARASCRVSVRYVPVEAVSLLSNELALSVGDDAAIECEVLPENASDSRLTYAVEPEGIVEIDRRGVVRAVAEGSCRVTVRAMDGEIADVLDVEVGPAPKRWRALLVGEQNYASTVAATRTGSINSVSGLRSMLTGLSFGGARFRVDTRLDASRDGILAGIAETFADARDGDVSLFYITCHGYYSGGMTHFRLYDGSVLTAAELAQALEKVPGEILVVIDCCGSGGVIGRASGTDDILRGVDAVFGGSVGPAAVSGSRFRVIASAALEQDSHRISFGEGAESAMATVFARALCEAGGWSLERSARSAMRADLDYDGLVTLNELYVYVARRVRWYLSLAGEPGQYAQCVQVWPEGDGGVVFAR